MSHHFGMALGTITAMVIGGAVVLDHFTSKPETESNAAATPAKSEAVADASTNGSATTLADAGKDASVPSAPVESRPQAPVPAKQAGVAAKSAEPPKKVATATLTPKTTNRAPAPIALAPPAPPAPATPPAPVASIPAPVELAPAAPAPIEPAPAPAPSTASTGGTNSPSIASDTAAKTEEARKAD